MTFEELLDQAIALLERRGRVTYRTLKRQFTLDDVALEDLKQALLYEHPQVVDDPGQGLIWRGDSTSAPQPLLQLAHPAPAGSSPTGPHPPDAERRQLTVMFCDLVDSTPLAGRLDPEDFRDVINAYLETCAAVIQQFNGYMAKYLGDGILVYFGYPRAHEHDAQRAVYAGLGIIEALGELNAQLVRDWGVRLAVRVGIHTGLVVAGELGGGSTREPLAVVGQSPNIAARLQGIAEPNTVLISAATHRLVQGYFAYQDLGLRQLKGVSTPIHVYRVHGERAAESRFEAASTAGLMPLVGREEELGLVLQRWAQARAGEGQVVLLVGEAGFGKSHLLQTVRERLSEESHIRRQYQCSPYHNNSAFYPIITQLERAARFEPGDTPTQKLDKLEALLAQATARVADVAPLFAELLSIPIGERYPPLSLSPQRQKAQTIAALIDQVVGLSRHQPVLCLVEDAHWCDPTTLEVLEQLVYRVPELRVLVVITARPEFEAPWMASHITTLTLTRLNQAEVVAMVARLTAGKALPTEVLAQIVAKTDGVPIFVEELTKMVLESGLLREREGHYELTGPLPPLAIPDTLHDSLMARLDLLIPAKEPAQLGATLGRAFSYDLLRAVSPWEDATLQHALARLMEAELLYQRGIPPRETYLFKHVLIQEAAYLSLLRSTRQRYHRRIAQVLAERFPEIVETQPELLAHHYAEAGLNTLAVGYWEHAGQRASARSAYVEAIGHLTKGLEMLKSLPDTPERARRELVLQTMLGPALMNSKGQAAPEVAHTYARARELCQQLGDVPQLFPVLWGLWYFYEVRAELQTARELGEQLLGLAQSAQDSALLLAAHRALGQNLTFLGELSLARTHLEQGMTLYDPQQHRSLALLYGQDLKVVCQSWAALALWLLGYPDQALQKSQEAVALARELVHPYSLIYALNWATMVYLYRREEQAAQEHAEGVSAIAREHGITIFAASGMLWQGWALVAQASRSGRLGEEGIAQMRQGLVAWLATGAGVFQPYYLALLGEAYGRGGQAEEGLRLLAEGLTVVDKTAERYWEAELYRLKGELLLNMGDGEKEGGGEGEIEECFKKALDVARRQQAKSLELRAAMSLSRLWEQQGKGDEAHQLLAGIYVWFTEGFDTTDLQEAKVLLDKWSG